MLAHPHLWVRLAAAQLIGFILAALDIDKVEELLNNPESDRVHEGYIYSKPVDTLRSLSLDLVAQLYPDMTFEQLADQVVKNLIFIAKILKSVSGSIVKNDEKDDGKAENSNNLSFLWLIRRLRKAVNIEITQVPKSTSVVRTSSFLDIFVSMKSFIDMYILYLKVNHMNDTFSENCNVQIHCWGDSDSAYGISKCDTFQYHVSVGTGDDYDRRNER